MLIGKKLFKKTSYMTDEDVETLDGLAKDNEIRTVIIRDECDAYSSGQNSGIVISALALIGGLIAGNIVEYFCNRDKH